MSTITFDPVTDADLQGAAPNGQVFAIKRAYNPLIGHQVAILFKQPDGSWTVKTSPVMIDLNQLALLGATALIVTFIPAINLVLKQLFPASAPAPAPGPAPVDPLVEFDATLASACKVAMVDGVPQVTAK